MPVFDKYDINVARDQVDVVDKFAVFAKLVPRYLVHLFARCQNLTKSKMKSVNVKFIFALHFLIYKNAKLMKALILDIYNLI